MGNFKIKFRRDRYYKARGGTAQALCLTCAQCGHYLCTYQKDGPGELYRIYWDRIFDPVFADRYRPEATQAEMGLLACNSCGHALGIPMTYAREDRLAWRLIPGSVHKSRSHV